MRPARKGPENRAEAFQQVHDSVRFNEAGPQGAGKPTVGMSCPDTDATGLQ